MTSQRLSTMFQSDFDPSHKTAKKEKPKSKKAVKKVIKKKKYKPQEQFIATVSH